LRPDEQRRLGELGERLVPAAIEPTSERVMARAEARVVLGDQALDEDTAPLSQRVATDRERRARAPRQRDAQQGRAAAAPIAQRIACTPAPNRPAGAASTRARVHAG